MQLDDGWIVDRCLQLFGDHSGDPEGKFVTAISWAKRIKPGSAAAHPGVYCLRTTLVDQDNANCGAPTSCSQSWSWCSALTVLATERSFNHPERPVGQRPERKVPLAFNILGGFRRNRISGQPLVGSPFAQNRCR